MLQKYNLLLTALLCLSVLLVTAVLYPARASAQGYPVPTVEGYDDFFTPIPTRIVPTPTPRPPNPPTINLQAPPVIPLVGQFNVLLATDNFAVDQLSLLVEPVVDARRSFEPFPILNVAADGTIHQLDDRFDLLFFDVGQVGVVMTLHIKQSAGLTGDINLISTAANAEGMTLVDVERMTLQTQSAVTLTPPAAETAFPLLLWLLPMLLVLATVTAAQRKK